MTFKIIDAHFSNKFAIITVNLKFFFQCFFNFFSIFFIYFDLTYCDHRWISDAGDWSSSYNCWCHRLKSKCFYIAKFKNMRDSQESEKFSLWTKFYSSDAIYEYGWWTIYEYVYRRQTSMIELRNLYIGHRRHILVNGLLNIP